MLSAMAVCGRIAAKAKIEIQYANALAPRSAVTPPPESFPFTFWRVEGSILQDEEVRFGIEEGEKTKGGAVFHGGMMGLDHGER
jgi:hypothetical protein